VIRKRKTLHMSTSFRTHLGGESARSTNGEFGTAGLRCQLTYSRAVAWSTVPADRLLVPSRFFPDRAVQADPAWREPARRRGRDDLPRARTRAQDDG
jgi:hypothetical protein